MADPAAIAKSRLGRSPRPPPAWPRGVSRNPGRRGFLGRWRCRPRPRCSGATAAGGGARAGRPCWRSVGPIHRPRNAAPRASDLRTPSGRARSGARTPGMRRGPSPSRGAPPVGRCIKRPSLSTSALRRATCRWQREQLALDLPAHQVGALLIFSPPLTTVRADVWISFEADDLLADRLDRGVHFRKVGGVFLDRVARRGPRAP